MAADLDIWRNRRIRDPSWQRTDSSDAERRAPELELRLIPQIEEKLPPLGPRKIRKLKFADVKRHFNTLRNSVCTVSQVNKSIKTVKAICTFVKAMKYVTTNIMEKYPKLTQVEEDGERTERSVNRGVFKESELQSIFAAATLFERALMGVLGLTGPRPGEVYALPWTEVYLDVERPYFRIVRSWCSKGLKFYKSKTEAGLRTVPINAWLASVLSEYHERCRVRSEPPKGLVFPAEFASLDRPASERVTSPVCEQALALYEAGVNRQEIAQRLDTTAKKISQLIWYERTGWVSRIGTSTRFAGRSLAWLARAVRRRSMSVGSSGTRAARLSMTSTPTRSTRGSRASVKAWPSAPASRCPPGPNP